MPFCSRTMVIELSWKLLTNLAANGGTHLYEQCAPWEWTYNSSVKWVVSAQNSWMKQPPSEWCNLRGWKFSCQPKQVRPWRLATFPAEVVSTDRSTRCSLIKSHPATWRKPLGRSERSTNLGTSWCFTTQHPRFPSKKRADSAFHYLLENAADSAIHYLLRWGRVDFYTFEQTNDFYHPEVWPEYGPTNGLFKIFNPQDMRKIIGRRVSWRLSLVV